ncbi:hypothetical protein B0H13DRAFT_2666890 [Mycena leptocephala]|nr:hypothetical protein B0H13DRAFT_2666890 [Mycena leptocephala]
MRNNFCVAALALAVATAAFAPTNTRRTSLLKKLSARSDVRLDQVAKPSPLPRTNAQRLARGLPLLKPRFRDPLHPPPARRSSTPPVTVRCNIKVASYDTPENVYGYLAPDIDPYGTLGTFLPDQTGAVEVSFTYSSGSYTQLDLAVTNSPSYPVIVAYYFGSTLDRDTSPWSDMRLGFTGSTPPGSPPVAAHSGLGDARNTQFPTESAIWSYDKTSRMITPQWINPPGAKVNPPTFIAFILTTTLIRAS